MAKKTYEIGYNFSPYTGGQKAFIIAGNKRGAVTQFRKTRGLAYNTVSLYDRRIRKDLL